MRVRATVELEFELPDSDEGYQDHTDPKVLGRVLPYRKAQLNIDGYNDGLYGLEECFYEAEGLKLLSLVELREKSESS